MDSLPPDAHKRSAALAPALIVLLLTGCTSPSAPPLARAQASALAGVDTLQKALPPTAVKGAVDKNGALKCGTGLDSGNGVQFIGHRWITVDPSLDWQHWLDDLERTYSSKNGWAVQRDQFGGTPSMRLTAPDGRVFRLARDSDGGKELVIITSYAVCAQSSETAP